VKPPLNSQLDEEIKQAWEALDEGRIVFKPNEQMRQGAAQVIKVRVARDSIAALTAGFGEGAVVESVKTSGFMTAVLVAEENEFDITELSSPDQPLLDKYIEWAWVVIPLKSGPLKLHLIVKARLFLSNGAVEYKDVAVKEATIVADVDRAWVIKGFFRDNWRYIFGSPLVIGLILWLVRKTRRSKPKRPAGFEQ